MSAGQKFNGPFHPEGDRLSRG